jgi:hypothetical protein
MDRRYAIQNIALLLGGTLSAPTLLALDRREANGANRPHFPDFVITDDQKQIIAEVAEMIIPRTTTPGARDTGVPAFIVMMLQDCYKTPEHNSFLAGLNNLEQKGFIAMDTAKRTDTLKAVERDSVDEMKAYQVQQTKMGDNEDREQMAVQAKGLPFWRLMKELTMLGYFTSEEGIKSSFDYQPVPGKLEMIQLKPNQKSFAY